MNQEHCQDDLRVFFLSSPVQMQGQAPAEKEISQWLALPSMLCCSIEAQLPQRQSTFQEGEGRASAPVISVLALPRPSVLRVALSGGRSHIPSWVFPVPDMSWVFQRGVHGSCLSHTWQLVQVCSQRYFFFSSVSWKLDQHHAKEHRGLTSQALVT